MAKLEYKDPIFEIKMHLNNNYLVCIGNEEVVSAFNALYDLNKTGTDLVKTVVITNGLPTYEVLITRIDNAVWEENIQLTDPPDLNTAKHIYNVPDYWNNLFISQWYIVRDILMTMLVKYHIEKIEIEWR